VTSEGKHKHLPLFLAALAGLLVGAGVTATGFVVGSHTTRPRTAVASLAPSPRLSPAPSAPAPGPTPASITPAAPPAAAPAAAAAPESDQDQITRIGKSFYQAYVPSQSPTIFRILKLEGPFTLTYVGQDRTAGNPEQVLKKVGDPLFQGNGGLDETERKAYGIPASHLQPTIASAACRSSLERLVKSRLPEVTRTSTNLARPTASRSAPKLTGR